MSYLENKDFLSKLFKQINKEVITKITVLNFDETPIREIQGRVLPGSSLNIDGSSSVRRTCTMSLLAEEEDNLTDVNNLLSLNKKIKLEQGIVNNYKKIFPEYADIDVFWFPLGIFVITTPAVNISTQEGIKINLNLSDKMCLLNGQCGGVLPATITFHEKDVSETDGTYFADREEKIEKVPIFQIIMELVNHWGKEDLSKILIQDIPLKTSQLVYSNYVSLPASFFSSEETDETYLYTDANSYYQLTEDDDFDPRLGFFQLRNITFPKGYYERNTTSIFEEETYVPTSDLERVDGKDYFVKSYSAGYLPSQIPRDRLYILFDGIEYNEQISEAFKNYELPAGGYIGYTSVDFVFPGELVGTQGQSVCDILDKIKGALSNYEYFYDVYGNFVFREIKNNLNISYATANTRSVSLDKEYYLANYYNDYYEYIFSNEDLITSITNSILYENIKNDYWVYGKGKKYSNSGDIRYHLAFDKKPELTSESDLLLLNNQLIFCDSLGGDQDAIGRISEYGISKSSLLKNYMSAEIVKELKSGIAIKRRRHSDFTETFSSKTIDNEECIYREYSNAADIPEEEITTFFYDEDEYTLYLPLLSLNLVAFAFLEEEIKETVSLIWVKIPLTSSLEIIDRLDITDFRTQLYINGVKAMQYYPDKIEENPYYAELANEWYKMITIKQTEIPGVYTDELIELTPESDLTYFLDIIDTDSKLKDFNISNIGKRTICENIDDINCLFPAQIPDMIDDIRITNGVAFSESDTHQSLSFPFAVAIESTDESIINDNTKIVAVCGFDDIKAIDFDGDFRCLLQKKNFTKEDVVDIGGKYYPALDAIKDLLYQHLSYMEQISLTSDPLYFLEPNIRIKFDIDTEEQTVPQGDFIVKTISYSLDADGQMTINANRALEKF